MDYFAFLNSLLLIVIAAPCGAGVLALMTWPMQGWRAAARSWWRMTVLFLALGAIGAVPALFTGGALISRACPGELFGYSCY